MSDTPKDYEQEINDSAYIFYKKNQLRSDIRADLYSYELGARWFRDTIHLPAMKEKEIKITNLTRDLKASQSTAEQLAEHIEFKNEENAKQSEEIEKLKGMYILKGWFFKGKYFKEENDMRGMTMEETSKPLPIYVRNEAQNPKDNEENQRS